MSDWSTKSYTVTFHSDIADMLDTIAEFNGRDTEDFIKTEMLSLINNTFFNVQVQEVSE